MIEVDRRRALLLAGGSLIGLLAGCGGGDSGSGAAVTVATAVATPTPTVTPSSTPTPTPAATPTPTALAALPAIVVQAGDSIGAGVGADGYAAIEHVFTSAQASVVNVSVGGRTMLIGYQRASIELFNSYAAGQTCILVIQQGTNDLATGTSDVGLYDDVLVPFVAAGKKAGFYVVVQTILPRSDPLWSGAREQLRLSYNAMVRANRAGADLVNDVAGDPVIGDPAGSGTAYYLDLLHPNLLGQQRIAIVDAAALTPLLASTPRSSS